MIAHDRESCPDCHGRPGKTDLAGFEGWNNPERFRLEIRTLIHKLELIAELERAIPVSFYADRDLLFRVQEIVAQWRTLTDAVRELSEELEQWKDENAKLKSELLKD